VSGDVIGIPDRDPWERLEGETPKAWAAFRHYAGTPEAERSLVRCCRTYYSHGRASNVKRWARWSSRFRWVERAAAWDAEKARAARKAELRAIETMRSAHVAVASELLDVVRMSVRRLRERMERNPNETLPARLWSQAITAASTLERVTRGEPSTIEEHREEQEHTTVRIVWSHDEDWAEIDEADEIAGALQ